ncbi:MAG: hypothetical protein R2747_20185 [Pyrinomonadaceae bacterium]
MRPNPFQSAFDLTPQWLEACPWPADQKTSLLAIKELAEAERQRNDEQVKFHETLQNRFDQLNFLIQKPVTPIQQPLHPTPVAPNLGNVYRPQIRYFRALVWNLENFTHDNRPAGTKPIESRRNQARIAIVADLAFRIGADALLIMETGSDVGQAMTLLANRWTLKEQNSNDLQKRTVEPLVSPATHGLSELPMKVPDKQFAPEPDRIRALMLIGEGYSVRPADLPNLTLEGLLRAFALLEQTSNNFQSFVSRPPQLNSLDGSLLEWAKWCLEGMRQGNFSLKENEDQMLIQRVLFDLISFPEQFLNQPETELGVVREAILAARIVASDFSSPSLESGIAEVIQLLLLALILRKGFGTLEPNPQMPSKSPPHPTFGMPPPVLLPSQLPLWVNDYGEPADLVVLALLLGTGQPLKLVAHDPENGPIYTASDGELLINGLIRLEILPKPRAETYGVAYRPYTPQHLETFFKEQYEDLGLGTKGIYGILHGNQTHGLLVSQQPKHVLAGRSALKINFPVTPEMWVPFALHHNRYSGSKEIRNLKPKEEGPESAVWARMETMEDEARFLAGQKQPALIVGDFNLPSAFVDPETGRKANNPAGRRRAALREKHVREMGGAGYLRRLKNDKTNPRTTLKRPLNIAKGKELFSEPYDAAYMPFDFLGGAVIVRSGVVSNYQAFFPPQLLAETISAATLQGSETLEIKQVMFDQVLYNYSGIIRLINATLTDAEPWLARHCGKFLEADQFLRGKREEFGKWLWGRKSFFAELLAKNIYGVFNIKDDYLQYMRKAISQVAPIVKEVEKEEKAPKKKSKKKSKKSGTGKSSKKKSKIEINTVDELGEEDMMDDSLFSDLLDDDEPVEESSASTPTKKVRKKKPGEQRLIVMGELFDAITNLEKRPDLRLWGTYGGLVSDHLPILVEVELPN